jgi:hypothetical protein
MDELGIAVTLTHGEYAAAGYVGYLRGVESKRAGLPDAHGLKSRGWSENIEGAMGEQAFAKALGIFWNNSVNTFKDPDFPPNIQIRTRPHPEHDLIVRQTDNPNDIFVLVTGACPNYVVRGFFFGNETRKEWLFNAGQADRPDQYFVPQRYLRPIETLREVSPEIFNSPFMKSMEVVI